MKKVLLIGPLLSLSGYGYHSRQVFNYLYSNEEYDLDCYVLPWGNTSWILNQDYENGLIKKVISCSIEKNRLSKKGYDIGVHVQLPNEWNTSYAKYNVGISAYVETDICNKDWVKNTLIMDNVIVPSSFTKKVIINSAEEKDKSTLDRKITVIPEYYHENFDLEIDAEEKIDKYLDNLPTKFNYLTVGQITSPDKECDRKNLVETIENFCNEFKNNSEVGLILKVSSGRSTTLDRLKSKKILNSMLKKIKGDSIYPRIYFLHGELKPEEMYKLYTHESIKYYISLTKGEGYGLPLLEAGRCSLPIIATNWSGHLDFLENNFIKVDFDLVNIPERKIDNTVFVKNSKWASVKASSVRKCLKESFKSHDSNLKKAKQLSNSIKRKFSNNTILDEYDKFFKKI